MGESVVVVSGGAQKDAFVPGLHSQCVFALAVAANRQHQRRCDQQRNPTSSHGAADYSSFHSASAKTGAYALGPPSDG